MCKNIHDNTGQDWQVVHELATKVIQARDDFFEYVSKPAESAEGESLREQGEEPTVYDGSLWNLFDAWTAQVIEEDISATPWLDPRVLDATWEQFLRLVPTIYLLICETYDKDPSRLYFVRRDPVSGTETRIECRVAMGANSDVVSAWIPTSLWSIQVGSERENEHRPDRRVGQGGDVVSRSGHALARVWASR